MAAALRHLGQFPVGRLDSVRQLDLHLLLQEVSGPDHRLILLPIIASVRQRDGAATDAWNVLVREKQMKY